MSSSLWIDFQKDSEVAILSEHQDVYPQVHLSGASQMVLLIRGPRLNSARRGIYIHYDAGRLVIECALHLETNPDPRSYDNASKNVIRHQLNNSSSQTSSKIAHAFYSLCLAPIAVCVAFVRGEFEDIDKIIHILALWASIRMSNRQTTKPAVLIIGTNRNGLALDRLLTAEIGANFNIWNPLRSGTREDFQQIWRNCFSDLHRGTAPPNHSVSISWVFQQAVACSTTRHPVPTAQKLCSLIEISCAHFTNYPESVLMPTSVFRTRPVSSELRSKVTEIFNLGLPRRLASSLAVSWLIQDTYNEGIEVTGK